MKKNGMAGFQQEKTDILIVDKDYIGVMVIPSSLSSVGVYGFRFLESGMAICGFLLRYSFRHRQGYGGTRRRTGFFDIAGESRR
jgi:hypothetical protein